MALPKGIVFTEPQNKPLDAAGRFQPNCTRQFLLTDGVTLATVYRDPQLQSPFSQSPTPITADGQGRFPPIYMNPNTVYRVKLFSATGTLLEDINPYINDPYAIQVATKRNATSITASTPSSAIITDPDLSISLPAAGTYLLEASLLWSSTETGVATQTAILAWIDSTSQDPTTTNAYALAGSSNVAGIGGSALLGANIGVISTINQAAMSNLRGVVTVTAAATLSVKWQKLASTPVLTIALLALSSLTAQRIG